MSTLKKTWGELKLKWVPHDLRDEIVDFVNHYASLTGIPAYRLVDWIGIAQSKFHHWRNRYGQENQHNGKISHDFWLEDWEKEAILAFHDEYPLEG